MAALKQKSVLRRRFAALFFLAGALVMGLGFMAPGAQAADVQAASTSTSIVVNPDDPDDPINLTCDDLDTDEVNYTEYKINTQPAAGTYDDFENNVQIVISSVQDDADPKFDFSWSATTVDGPDAGTERDPYFFGAVIVKQASTGYPVYFYDPPVSSGDAVSSGNGISHVSFCDKGQPTTTTEPEGDDDGTTTSTTLPEETTTTGEVGGTDDEVTTTVAVDPTTAETVLGVVVTAPAALPATGSSTTAPMIMMGAALIIMGFGSLIISKEMFARN